MAKRRRSRPASAYAKTILLVMGYSPWPVEVRIPMPKAGPFAFFTRDAWGFADWMGFSRERGFIFVQVTVEDRRADHAVSVAGNPVAQGIVASGWARVDLWTVSKRGKRGERKMRYMRLEELVHSNETGEYSWVDRDLVPLVEAERARRQAEATTEPADVSGGGGGVLPAGRRAVRGRQKVHPASSVSRPGEGSATPPLPTLWEPVPQIGADPES